MLNGVSLNAVSHEPLPSPFKTGDVLPLVDYHVHTNVSFDAKDDISSVCMAAIAANVKEIAITDHCGCENKKELDSISRSFEAAKYAMRQFSPSLCVKAGVELSEAMHNKDAAKSIIDSFDFDFVLGALHNLEGYKDFYYMENESNPHYILDTYFDELLSLALEGDFDVLAHITYPFRYKAFWGISFEPFMDKITAIFSALVRFGRGLEINTSGLKIGGDGKMIPSLELLKLYRSLGGEIITFGSDSHRAKDVAVGIPQAMTFAKNAGFRHYAIYNKRIPSLVSF